MDTDKLISITRKKRIEKTYGVAAGKLIIHGGDAYCVTRIVHDMKLSVYGKRTPSSKEVLISNDWQKGGT